jgi:GTP 3',8-cyclase
MDRFKIDDTKIKYHPERVAEWYKKRDSWDLAKTINPIYIEISPVGACNHRCTFCAVDYIGYKADFWDTGRLCQRLSEMAEAGVKSVMFAGEGEPLLHKDMAEITCHSAKAGLDVSFTTNGVLLTPKFIDKALGSIAWIKVSLNAGDAETYEKIHRTKASDFEKVFANLEYAVQARKSQAAKCALGAQLVLVPDNIHSVEALVKRCRDIGLDYVVIKPYSQHLSSHTHQYEEVDYKPMLKLRDELEQYNCSTFHVVFRIGAMTRHLEGEKHYERCHATPYLWAYLMANGDLYGCSAFLKNEDFNYGDLNKHTFKEAWEGEKRRLNFEQMKNGFDLSKCRHNCRMEVVNLHLEDLVHPPEHVNFI